MNLRSLWSAFAFVLLATGCSFHPVTPGTVTWHADKTFSPMYRDCLEEASDTWRSQTSGKVDFRITYDYTQGGLTQQVEDLTENRIVAWYSFEPRTKQADDSVCVLPDGTRKPDPCFILGQENGHSVLDRIHKAAEVRLVVDRIGQDYNKCVLTTLHEFGHSLGLRHTNQRTYVMYPSVEDGRTPCLKVNDLAQFCAFNDCSGHEMKSCPDQANMVNPTLPFQVPGPMPEDAELLPIEVFPWHP